MKKQKRVLKTIVALTMLLVLLTPMISFATNETEETTIIFYTNTNTDVYNLGENVKASITWENHTGNITSNSDVQAIGFTLQYDESKLEFTDATFNEVAEDNTIQEITLEEDSYNTETPGTLVLSKVSLNDLDISGINFNFKTTAIGEAVIQLAEVDCVADGNLVSPDVIDFTTNSLATIKTVAFGDVDLSGTTDIGDTVLLGQYLEGTKELTEQQLENADVNLDGAVDAVDVELIQESLASVISLPIRYGDVDLDGKIITRDIVCLNDYLNNVEGIELSKQALINADTNVDGLVNDIDVAVIRLFLSTGWDFGMPFKMIKNTNVKATDRENLHIVSGFDLGKTKVSELLENFNTDNGFKVCNSNNEVLEDDAIFGTGTKINLGGDGNTVQTEFPDGSKSYWAAEFNVVIYGDTTGDGKINAIDALALIKHLNEAIPFTSEVFIEAGSIVCEEGAEPTAVDALAIIKHANKKQLISQTK